MLPLQSTLEQYLEQIANGDQTALTRLYEAVSARLFGIQIRILKDRELAEDALQETLIKVWNSAGSFDAKHGAPMTWLNSLARNQALDILRRTKTRSAVNVQIPDLDFDTWRSTAREYSDNVSDFESLSRCLEQLGQESQASIVGMYCEGYTQEELSQTLEKPIGTVKSWIRRGLAALKRCLDNEQ